MKYSNFKLVKIVGDNPLNWKFKASVVETSGWIFKKKRTIYICRDFGDFWFFEDSGKYAPMLAIERLERSYKCKQGKELKDCDITK